MVSEVFSYAECTDDLTMVGRGVFFIKFKNYTPNSSVFIPVVRSGAGRLIVKIISLWLPIKLAPGICGPECPLQGKRFI